MTNPGPGSNIIGREDSDFSDFSIRLDYGLGGATLTSISPLADAQQDVYGGGDFLPVDVVFQDLTFTSDVFNQELRLNALSEPLETFCVWLERCRGVTPATIRRSCLPSGRILERTLRR